jgi:hypothetical protein
MLLKQPPPPPLNSWQSVSIDVKATKIISPPKNYTSTSKLIQKIKILRAPSRMTIPTITNVSTFIQYSYQKKGHYATSGKIAGSIPDIIGIYFDWSNPSSRTMALGTTQPVEMCTRNLPGGKGQPARKADNLTAIYEPTSFT